MSEQPQEWTREYVAKMFELNFTGDTVKVICDAHNAAVAAAVREAILNDVGTEGSEYIIRLEQQLAAERQNAEKAAARAELAQIQLATAHKGWSQEVTRADNAESAVGENCKTIARLEKELADWKEGNNRKEVTNETTCND